MRYAIFTRGCFLLLVCLLCLSLGARSQAESLQLPTSLTAIDDYAYENCTSISSVILPSGLLSIGQGAFAGCEGLTVLTVPDTVESIGEEAFPEGITLYVSRDSFAMTWAQEHGVAYRLTNPARFALLIGQSYENTPTLDTLEGPDNDVHSLQTMLGSMSGTPYWISLKQDLTANGILSAASSVFSEALPGDICLLYYSGHGNYSTSASLNGAMIGVDDQLVTMSQLRAVMDTIPAEKIIVMDSCYSGQLLQTNSTMSINQFGTMTVTSNPSMDLDAVNSAIIQAFTRRTRSSVSQGNYYLMAAARSTEASEEMYSQSTGKYYGVFTCALLYGSGYNERLNTFLNRLPADSNGDGAITLHEGYTFAESYALTINSGQHAQVYPQNSSLVLWKK
ncbi:MAG: caspase family protein [Clostridia bacterium]|nr:caspase family protein [Clostridia bacterium]